MWRKEVLLLGKCEMKTSKEILNLIQFIVHLPRVIIWSNAKNDWYKTEIYLEYWCVFHHSKKNSGAIIYIGDNYSNANNEYINDYDEYKKCTYDKYVGCVKWIVYTDNV